MTSTQTEAPQPPLPEPDPVTQFFWDGIAEGELRIQRCQNCGHYLHYPKVLCRYCQSDDLKGERVSGRATLYTWTIAVGAATTALSRMRSEKRSPYYRAPACRQTFSVKLSFPEAAGSYPS